MGLFNKKINMLAEACSDEADLQINSDVDGIASEIAKNYKIIEELEEGVFVYTSEMIPVICKETAVGKKYLVEFAMINKFSKQNKMSFNEGFKKILEANDITDDDTYVVMDDDDDEEDIDDILDDEACSIKNAKSTEKKTSKKNKLAKANKALKELAELKIHLMRTK